MIRVAIANDTLIALEALRRAIATDLAYKLVWTARSGDEAITLAADHPPDLILMDLLMPKIDGVEATRQIMARSPCAILIVTGSVRRNTSKVFEAMSCGALDVVQTPVMSYRQDVATAAKPLLAKMLTVTKFIGKYRTDYKTAERPAASAATSLGPLASSARARQSASLPALTVIGASTGGPKALAQIFSQLPANFAGAIVVVQHIDRQFAAGLARWLDIQSALPVALAQEGDRPQSGQVLLAQADGHLVMQGDRTLQYTTDVPPASGLYCPSVDVFFSSVAQHWPKPGTAIVLTGMGRDGATGLMALRVARWQTIAESEQSCVIYGMPRAAIESGAARSILASGEIARTIASQKSRLSRRCP